MCGMYGLVINVAVGVKGVLTGIFCTMQGGLSMVILEMDLFNDNQ